MDIVGPLLLVVVGLVMLGSGWRAGIRTLTLGGAANIAAAYLLFPNSAFGIGHYVALAILIVVVLAISRSINRDIWRGIRVEMLLATAVIATIWALEFLGALIPRPLELVLLAVIAVLTTVLIGLIVRRLVKEHCGHSPQEAR